MSICVVVFPAPGVGGFVGVCVEKDIATQGDTLDDVHYNMECVLATHALLDAEAGCAPLSTLPDAPKRHRLAFMRAERRLAFECLEIDFPDASDMVRERARSIRGPRHYRYTKTPPPCPWPPLPDGGRSIAV